MSSRYLYLSPYRIAQHEPQKVLSTETGGRDTTADMKVAADEDDESSVTNVVQTRRYGR
jgi:hypothetical protein